MDKKYTSSINRRSPRPRSKRLREQGIGGHVSGTAATAPSGNDFGLQDSLLNFRTGVNTLLVPCDSTGAEMTWEEATQIGTDGNIKAKSLKAKVSLWSAESLAGKGLSGAPSGGGGGGSLFGLYTDTTWVSTPADDDALSAVLGKSLHARVSVLEGAGYLTGITKAMVEAVLTGDIKSHTHSQYIVEKTAAELTQLFVTSGADSKIVLNNTDSDTKYQMISFRQNGSEYGWLGTAGDDALKWSGYTLLHTGNYASTLDGHYLARSGGSMSNTNLVNNLNANYLGGYTHEQIRRNALGFTPTVVPTSSGNCDLDLLKEGMARNYWGTDKWVHAPEGFGFGAAVVFAPFGYNTLHGQLAWDVNHLHDNVTRNLYWRVFATATGGTDKWGGWRQFAFTDLGYGMQETTIDATGLDENTYYPVTFAIGNCNTVRIEFLTALDSYTKPAWSTHPSGYSVRLIVEVNGYGWGISNFNTTVYEADYIWASAPPVAGLGQMTNSSTEYVYVRGGGRYRIRTSHGIVPVLRTSSYTISSQTITPTTTVPAEIKRTNALITDNVASATKLLTARSIWGQSFDGTAAISGELQHVTALRFDSGNALVEGLGNAWNLWSVNGFHFFPTLSATVSALSITANGRVGVNMYAPLYDFDVTGVIHASGEIFSDKAIGGKGMTSSSDIRLKHIVGDVELSFEAILNSPSKRFTWLGGADKNERIGTIAQYWLPILPQVVYTSPDGYYAVDYGTLANAKADTIAHVVAKLIKELNEVKRQLKSQPNA